MILCHTRFLAILLERKYIIITILLLMLATKLSITTNQAMDSQSFSHFLTAFLHFAIKRTSFVCTCTRKRSAFKLRPILVLPIFCHKVKNETEHIRTYPDICLYDILSLSTCLHFTRPSAYVNMIRRNMILQRFWHRVFTQCRVFIVTVYGQLH